MGSNYISVYNWLSFVKKKFKKRLKPLLCNACAIVEVCVALYAFSSNVDGDLTFSQGDVISVIQSDGEWWTGIKDGRTGIFPANYVKKMEASAKVQFYLTMNTQRRQLNNF